jgi:hypothetical protein
VQGTNKGFFFLDPADAEKYRDKVHSPKPKTRNLKPSTLRSIEIRTTLRKDAGKYRDKIHTPNPDTRNLESHTLIPQL